MTIKAFVLPGRDNGVEINDITPPICCSQYNGLLMEMAGTTLKDGHWQRSSINLYMSQKEALDMALALFDAAAKHADNNANALPKYAKMIQRRAKKLFY